MSKLAIVIPAYKGNFFNETLLSIANQTCKDFTLYIGDDSSPFQIEEIVNQFTEQIDIVYKRFDENLGANDLVSHWERCIDLVRDEEWIWLFSDDDIMGQTCVEMFFENKQENPEFNLYHFDVSLINEQGAIVQEFYSFPDVFRTEDFILAKLKQPNCFSVIVEYIFRKSTFIKEGRFQNFDLAWGSDDATWIKLSKEKGIKNISSAKVFWRKSQYNISPSVSSTILERKYWAQIEFYTWLCNYVEVNKLNLKMVLLQKQLNILLSNGMKNELQYLSFRTVRKIWNQFHDSFREVETSELKYWNFYLWKLYRTTIFFANNFFSALTRFGTS